MKINQKEIILLAYPFSNLEERKYRPAVVISNDYYNNKSKDCILVPLTSVIKNEPYSILINNQNLLKGNLIKPSRIKLDKIFCISKNMIVTKIGIVNNMIFEEIRKGIFELI